MTHRAHLLATRIGCFQPFEVGRPVCLEGGSASVAISVAASLAAIMHRRFAA